MEKNDWRLTNQMSYLFEKPLFHVAYEPYRPGWEHDHCDFCTDTIDAQTGLAYCTMDKYHWICSECFKDFKDMFNWKNVSKETGA